MQHAPNQQCALNNGCAPNNPILWYAGRYWSQCLGKVFGSAWYFFWVQTVPWHTHLISTGNEKKPKSRMKQRRKSRGRRKGKDRDIYMHIHLTSTGNSRWKGAPKNGLKHRRKSKGRRKGRREWEGGGGGGGAQWNAEKKGRKVEERKSTNWYEITSQSWWFWLLNASIETQKAAWMHAGNAC